MAISTALVPYRPIPSTTLSTRSTPLGLTRVFTAQTGTAIATELLYRLLWDILQRLLTSLHGFAGRRLEAFSTYLETRYEEHEALQLTKKNEGLGIVDAVEKLEQEKRWGEHWPGPACPMTGHPMSMRGPPGPPRWVEQAAGGWTESEWKVHVLGD